MTSFEVVYRRNVDTVYRICFLHMRNQQETEDCVQEIFLKFYEKPRTFDSTAHEKAWFIVVAKNHCRDILKSSWSHVDGTEWSLKVFLRSWLIYQKSTGRHYIYTTMRDIRLKK